MGSMAIRVVEFSNVGYKNRMVFALESTYLLEGNYWVLRIGLMGALEVFKNQSFENQLLSSSQKKIPQIDFNVIIVH